jgi:beta-1,4-mannosyltransferase
LGLPELAETARPLVVSATSYGPDEDFAILVGALEAWSAVSAPLFLVTGRGPGRATLEATARGRAPALRTAWLPPDDYRSLLACADVGLCLHRSSSGLDLPMKVVDMLGAGLPVLAFDYGACVRELVRPGENGLLFDDAQALRSALTDVLEDFPRSDRLRGMRESIAARPLARWPDDWRRTALPALMAAAGLPCAS